MNNGCEVAGKLFTRGATRALALALVGVCFAGTAVAQDYPSKPVKMIVPYAPGGPADVLARLMGEKLSERLGQPVIIENRGGGGATIGTAMAGKASPDGYTIMIGSITTHAISPAVSKRLSYDPVRDFTPITDIASVPFVLVVNPRVPANSVGELIALAKANKGTLSYASAGPGTSIHLAGELFKMITGTDFLHVPYRGMGPAQIDVQAGQVTMMFDTTITAMPRVATGALKVLAITTPQRMAFAPSLPTVSEAGAPGFAIDAWLGIFGPAGLPEPIVLRLNKEIAHVMAQPEVQERLKVIGGVAKTSTPAEFSAYVKSELEKWAGVAKRSGITVD